MDVLIVERDDLVGSVLANALSDEGIAATVLPDERALRLPPDQPPQLVITGINRGHKEDLKGLKVVVALHRKWPELPVVYLAALWPARLSREVLAANERFLPKPVPMAEVTRTVRELLDDSVSHERR